MEKIDKAGIAKGVLLKRYFDRRSLSMINDQPFFKLVAVQFGYGFLDTSVDPAQVADIPLDATKLDITNVYIDRNPSFTFNPETNQVLVRTEIPAGVAGIPANGVNVNACCVLDEEEEAVAFLVSQLSVVNSERGYLVTGTIETNLN